MLLRPAGRDSARGDSSFSSGFCWRAWARALREISAHTGLHARRSSSLGVEFYCCFIRYSTAPTSLPSAHPCKPKVCAAGTPPSSPSLVTGAQQPPSAPLLVRTVVQQRNIRRRRHQIAAEGTLLPAGDELELAIEHRTLAGGGGAVGAQRARRGHAGGVWRFPAMGNRRIRLRQRLQDLLLRAGIVGGDHVRTRIRLHR